MVVDEDNQTMIVISGRGFNTTPGSDLLWTIAAEPNGTVHPNLVMNRTRPELTATPLQVSPDAVRRHLAVIARKILAAPA